MGKRTKKTLIYHYLDKHMSFLHTICHSSQLYAIRHNNLACLTKTLSLVTSACIISQIFAGKRLVV